MLKISDNQYLLWQEKLADNSFFRRFWAFWGIYVVGFFYAGTVLFFFARWRAMAALALAAFLLAALVVCKVVYFFYNKKRPYQRLNFTPPASPVFLSSVNKKFDSIPSRHAASLVAISLVCLAFSPWFGVAGLVAAAFNSIARVILGYHHISDVFAGWTVGILSALVIVYWLFPLLFTPR